MQRQLFPFGPAPTSRFFLLGSAVIVPTWFPLSKPQKRFLSEAESGAGKEQNQSGEMEEIGIYRSAHSSSGTSVCHVVHARATLVTDVLLAPFEQENEAQRG